MLSRIGVIFVDDRNINKLVNIAKLVCLIGMFAIIAFPYISENIYVMEKVMKHSNTFDNQLVLGTFQKSVNQFYDKLKLQQSMNKPFNFEAVVNIFEDFDNFHKEVIAFDPVKSKEKAYIIHINSPRGDQRKSIVLTFVIENSNSAEFYKNKNLYMMYTLCSHFSNKDNMQYMSKDLKIVLVPKEIFYDKPSLLTELFITDQRFLNPQVEYIINMDLLNDLSDMNALVLKTTGMNAELDDMDYYTTMFLNLSIDFKKFITSNDVVFSRETKSYLRDIFDKVNKYLHSLLFVKDLKYENYPRDYVYFLEFMLDSFIRVNKNDFNSQIISEKGLNSVLIKTRVLEGRKTDSSTYDNSLNSNTSTKSQKLNYSYNFLQALERIIITLTLTEITIFRGERNYILCSPETFVSMGRFVLLPALCVVILVYQCLISFMKTNYKGSKELIMTMILLIAFSVYICLEIENIDWLIRLLLSKTRLQTDLTYQITFTYWIIMSLIFLLNISFILTLVKDDQKKRIYLSKMRYFTALNSFLILFINPAFGFIISYFMLLLEIIYYDLDEKYFDNRNKKMQVIKVVLNLGLQYVFYIWKWDMHRNIITNYIQFFNNPYFCSSLIHIFLTFHLGYSLVLIFCDRNEIDNEINNEKDNEKVNIKLN